MMAASGLPCIPEGESITFGGTPPPTAGLGLEQPSEWADGSNPALGEIAPQIGEDDPLADDDMGEGSWIGGNVAFDISNAGGTLSGPNGTPQNGGTEGDCIEVYVDVPYWYQVTVSQSWGVSFGDLSWGSTRTTCVWQVGYYRVGEYSVCPC
jgi:hypothetical protein